MFVCLINPFPTSHSQTSTMTGNLSITSRGSLSLYQNPEWLHWFGMPVIFQEIYFLRLHKRGSEPVESSSVSCTLCLLQYLGLRRHSCTFHRYLLPSAPHTIQSINGRAHHFPQARLILRYLKVLAIVLITCFHIAPSGV